MVLEEHIVSRQDAKDYEEEYLKQKAKCKHIHSNVAKGEYKHALFTDVLRRWTVSTNTGGGYGGLWFEGNVQNNTDDGFFDFLEVN